MMLPQKFRSAIIICWRNFVSFLVKSRVRLLYANVNIGKNVTFGRMVSVRTSDGGKIVIGDNVKIDDFCLLVAQKGTLAIGVNTYVGQGSHLCAIEKVTIGCDCLIAACCVIRDMKHGMAVGSPMASQPQSAVPVILGDDVWLGAHAVVTSGVTLGKGSVVGANSVVTKDVAENTIVGGVPAGLLKKRS